MSCWFSWRLVSQPQMLCPWPTRLQHLALRSRKQEQSAWPLSMRWQICPKYMERICSLHMMLQITGWALASSPDYARLASLFIIRRMFLYVDIRSMRRPQKSMAIKLFFFCPVPASVVCVENSAKTVFRTCSTELLLP